MTKQTAEIKIQLTNGKEAGKTMNQLTTESVKLNSEIKKLEIGSDDWVKKTGEYKQINTHLKNVKKEVYATEEAQKGLNSTLFEMLPFSDQLQGFAGGFGDVRKGIKGATVATNLWKVALASTGIGLIIIALGTLFTWLTKTQQGMDFVSKAGAALRAVFQVIIDRVITFGGAMKNLIAGKFGAAWDGMKESLSGIGKEMAHDAKEAYNMSGALLEIVQAQKVLDGQRKKSRAEIERLKMVSEDLTASEKERSEAAAKALAMEQDMMAKSIDLGKRKVEVLKAENALKENVTNEDTNRVIEAEIELADLMEESYGKQTELNNKNNELMKSKAQSAGEYRQQQAEKQKEADAKALKEKEEWDKKILEADKTLQDQRIALITDDQDRKIAEITMAAEREIAAFEGSEEQKKAFLILKQKEQDAAIDAVIEENNLKAREKNFERLEEESQMMEERINEDFFNKLISEEDRNEQLYQLEKSAIEKRLALMVASKQTETLEYQQLYTQLAQLHSEYEADKTKNTQREEQARASLQQQGFQVASDLFGSVIGLLERDEAAKRKNFQIIKALKIAELKISYINTLAGIWENAEKSPLNALFPGAAQVLAIVKTVAASARFATGVVQVSSAKFAQGGPIKGPSHEAGGIPFRVKGSNVRHEMEGDEIILSKGVYRDPILRTLASDLNVMGGGRSFAMGGPVTRIEPPRNKPDTSYLMSQSTNTTDMKETNGYLKKLADNSDVIAKHTGISAKNPPPISIQKVREGLNTLSNVEREARF